MQFEASTQINATSAAVFSLYSNVAGWPTWDPDVKAASVTGDFVSGAGTQATHRVIFQGPLAPLFGRLIGSGMRKTLPHALAGLKQAAEAAV
jgi:hypothetical protein